MWQHSYPPLNDWTENQIAAFEAEYPSIDVTFELVPFEEYNQKILTALAAGEGPQVFESDDYTFAQFTENGVLAPIDPAALGFDSVADLTAGYTANSLALVTAEDGTVLGIPYDHEAPVVSYNIGLLADAGVDPASLTTWDAVMAAAETMTVRDGDRLVQSGFSFVHGIDVYYQLQGTTLFNQAGARVLSEDGTEAAINSPESRRVFEFWRDVVHTYGVSEPGFTSTFYTDEFGTGRVAMGWMYVWANSILAPSGYENGVDFDIIAPPTFDGDGAPSASYAWNWTINSTTSGDELIASQALLGYLSQQGASQLSEAGLINPRSGWVDGIDADLRSDFEQILASLENSEPITPTSQFNEIWAPIIELFKEVEQDADVDIDARLAEVEAEINQILEG